MATATTRKATDMIPNYQIIRLNPVKTGVCVHCGKRGRRTAVFEQTVNPWNTNPDGTAKTPREVYAAVDAEAEAWQAQPFMHAKCETGTSR